MLEDTKTLNRYFQLANSVEYCHTCAKKWAVLSWVDIEGTSNNCFGSKMAVFGICHRLLSYTVEKHVCYPHSPSRVTPLMVSLRRIWKTSRLHDWQVSETVPVSWKLNEAFLSLITIMPFVSRSVDAVANLPIILLWTQCNYCTNGLMARDSRTGFISQVILAANAWNVIMNCPWRPLELPGRNERYR